MENNILTKKTFHNSGFTQLNLLTNSLISNPIIRFFVIPFYLSIFLSFYPLYPSFDQISLGARATAMGNALTATTNDVYSVYYNPAGLGYVSWQEVGLDYEKLLLGLTDNSNLNNSFLGYVYPLKKYGTLGVSMSNFSLENYYQESNYAISYGNKMKKLPISTGVNFKLLSRGYGKTVYTEDASNLNTGQLRGDKDPVFVNGYSKQSIAFDLGIIYKVNKKNSLGMVLNNINQPDLGLVVEDKVPLVTKFGYGYTGANVGISCDCLVDNNDVSILSGIEYLVIRKYMVLRAGLNVGNRDYTDFSLGFGIKYNQIFNIDYSFNYPVKGITNFIGTHKVSLTLKFGEVISPYDEVATAELEIESLRKELENIKRHSQEIINKIAVSEQEKEEQQKIILEAKEKEKLLQEKINSLKKSEEPVVKIEQPVKTIQQKVIYTKEQLVENLWAEAEGFLKTGDYVKCIEKLNELLSINPNHEPSLRKIEDVKNRLAQKYKSQTEQLYTDGLKLYYEEKLDEAVKVWGQALKLNPYDELIKSAYDKAKKELQLKK